MSNRNAVPSNAATKLNLTKENTIMTKQTNLTITTNTFNAEFINELGLSLGEAKQEVISMQDINKSALVSTISAELFHNGLTPAVSLRAAAAYVGAVDYLDDSELFAEMFLEGLEITEVAARQVVEHDGKPAIVDTPLDEEFSGADVVEALEKARFFTEEGLVGERLGELCAMRTEAYAPTLASEGIARRFGYAKVKFSPLFVEAVHALEETQYTVDETMLSIALQVQSLMGGEEEDKEAYVLRGCQKMDAARAYISEFKGDNRARMYQAACHGPNGQSSDRSRSLQDLVGVPTDYNVKSAIKLIMAEMGDMTSDIRAAAIMRRELGDVKFIVANLTAEKPLVSKPWSFVKAARIMAALKAGERPYIGMAVGLDAKCSGPQLGALLVGDQKIAAACGFTMEQLADAYALAIVELEKAGFHGLVRNDVKKPYMGIFYGQGWGAFTNPENVSPECWAILHKDGIVTDEAAKKFHKAIMASFGTKMNTVRNMIKQYGKVSSGRTKHFMPCGFEVAMNYKHQQNVLGETLDYETKAYDVFVRNNVEQYKFINFAINTKEVHEGDFARNGFVNMIQGVDALIARLIIVHLKRLGAKHIISVHDCFRVNITEMELLEKAIKLAYSDLFGFGRYKVTQDLPMGTDILGMYFEGANKQLVEGVQPTMVSQFTSKGTRYLQKVNGEYVNNLIAALGQGSYYFAK